MDKFWSMYTCCVHMHTHMSLCMCVCVFLRVCVCVCVCVCVWAKVWVQWGCVDCINDCYKEGKKEGSSECVCVYACVQARKHTRVIFCSCLSKDSWEECSHSSINIDLSFTQTPSKPTKTALSSQTLNICAALLLAVAGDAAWSCQQVHESNVQNTK